MFEEMKKEDFINDFKALIVWLTSILLSKEVSGIIGVIGAILAIVYMVYRINKIKFDIQTARIERDTKQIQLENAKNLHKENLIKDERKEEV